MFLITGRWGCSHEWKLYDTETIQLIAAGGIDGKGIQGYKYISCSQCTKCGKVKAYRSTAT